MIAAALSVCAALSVLRTVLTKAPDVHFKEDNPGTWHSQLHQDKYIHALLNGQRGGYFVDLAANHPVSISNTRTLERDFGWSGLCIEPNPHYYKLLLGVRSCIIANVAISSEAGEVKFASRGYLGGVISNRTEHHGYRPSDGRRKTGEVLTVPSVPLSEALARAGTPPIIDYLSLDIEGHEYIAMSTFPWANYTVRALTVERPDAQLLALFREHGYRYLCGNNNVGDQLWVHPTLVSHRAVTALGQAGQTETRGSCKGVITGGARDS